MRKITVVLVFVSFLIIMTVSCSKSNNSNVNIDKNENENISDNIVNNNIEQNENDVVTENNTDNNNENLEENLEDEVIIKDPFILFLEGLMQKHDTDQILISYQNNKDEKFKGVALGYERNYSGEILKTFDTIDVVFGKEGMDKEMEGDKKSPTGIFEIPYAFGYFEDKKVEEDENEEREENNQDIEKEEIEDITFTFIETTENDYWVDDVDSEDYNDWKTLNDQDPDEVWNSYERLRIPSYQYAFLIDYNSDDKKGLGSAIFFHIWKSENSYTSGCTATSKENMVNLLKWLDQYKDPIIIQGDNEYFIKEHGIDLEEVIYE